ARCSIPSSCRAVAASTVAATASPRRSAKTAPVSSRRSARSHPVTRCAAGCIRRRRTHEPHYSRRHRSAQGLQPASRPDLDAGRPAARDPGGGRRELLSRSEEHTSELQSLAYLVCRLLLEKKKRRSNTTSSHLRLPR